MAKNQRYTHGLHIALPAIADTESGAPVSIGGFRGVAQTSAVEGERVAIWLDGSYNLDVTGVVAIGQQVNITETGDLTTDDEGEPFGLAVTAKAASAVGIVEVAPFGKVPAYTPAVVNGDG